MLEGLLSVFDFAIANVTAKQKGESLAIVIYHLLGDVTNAIEHALIHYLPLSLSEQFLQNSGLGSPYQKWAKFTNDDFQQVDQCLSRLIHTSGTWYMQRSSLWQDGPAIKDAYRWFGTAKTDYVCCIINPNKHELTLSVINIAGWVDVSTSKFFNVWNGLSSEYARLPPIVTKSVRDIGDRRVVNELQQIGLSRLQELRETTLQFGSWIRSNYTLEQITASHSGTLSRYSF